MTSKHQRAAKKSIKTRTSVKPDEILDTINRLPSNIRNNMKHGNCGVFAIALKKIFKKGLLIAVFSDYLHVALKVGEEYYDADGVKTKDMLLRGNYVAKREAQEQEWDEPAFNLIEIDEHDAEKYTEPDLEVDEVISIIRQYLKV